MATLKAVNLKEEERTNVCSPYWSPFTQRPLILNRNAFVNPTSKVRIFIDDCVCITST